MLVMNYSIKLFTFSPSALMAFSMSVKFMVSTLRITGTTSPYKNKCYSDVVSV